MTYPTSFEAPRDWADNYGTRMRGYVYPPVSGYYSFWIASDDTSELLLSTDETPGNATVIASVTSWTGWREYTKMASQQSAPIYLSAGQRYYIEALQKENGGGDSLSVRWQLPGGVWENPADPSLPIPGNRLSPYLSGYLVRECWEGIGGTAVTDLTSNANYPNDPTEVTYPTSFEAPHDWADNYGTRVRGYVTPPVTGQYTFWIASDDNSVLYLSTDEDPAHKVQIAQVSSWTPSRAFDTYAEQKSVAITLVAGLKYYIEALQKENDGGDNLAVRWQMPGGVWENPADTSTPIPGIHLSPYVTSTAPLAYDDRYQVTGDQTLSVAAAGVLANDMDPAPGPLSLAAQIVISPRHAQTFVLNSDGSFQYVPVAGYVGADHFMYRAFDGVEYSLPATALITVVGPIGLSSVIASDATHVRVVFGADVQKSSAEAAGNYAVNGDISVESASLGIDLRTVTLTVSPMTPDHDYVVTINNVRDAGGVSTIAPNTQGTFRYSVWSGKDIGLVATPGTQSPTGGTWTITASGDDIWNTADAFHYVYQPFTGDGFIIARVQSVSNTDGWAKAGVMFRDTLDAGSAFAFTCVTPGNGVSIQYRTQANGGCEWSGTAGTAPYWVSLSRSGDIFSGYASADGRTWTLVGSVTVPMTQQTIYVGLAVTAHNNAAVCMAVMDSVAGIDNDTTSPTASTMTVTLIEPNGFADALGRARVGPQLSPVPLPTASPVGGRGVSGLLRFSDVGGPAAARRIDALPAARQRSALRPARLGQFVGVSEFSDASGLSVLTTDLLDVLQPLRLRLAGLPTGHRASR